MIPIVPNILGCIVFGFLVAIGWTFGAFLMNAILGLLAGSRLKGS